ncbi:putative beta-1,4-mannosyltransferase [Kockovaella imperatae]|uniref:Chitobiosyldiphosphodolichol beta-mannosyltransferase n=1 Tax=Kockovaella imperatae TaxID=4999 RepID=A0A1Y1UKV1_9TREE|nr:putative beta-1,4-mannosyltransferase [Kockovaella imperatae]ORX38680.1 putative beta-1,4-mannosyltransferase [Kockovaella imperatae]
MVALPSSTAELLLVSLVSFLCILTGFLFLFIRFISNRPSRHRTAIVLVLGDIGRSPRMMYHAESLARHDWIVAMIGYDDTPPIPALQESPNVKPHALANPPRVLLKVLPWILRAPLRIVYQVWSVLKIALWDIPVRTEFLILQNPPSIPTLALAQFICWTTGAKLVIDWHNTGCSILAMRVGESSPLYKIATAFEAGFGRKAFAHLFVTQALRDHLVKAWKLQGITAILHDRPPTHFHRSLPLDEHGVLRRLSESLENPLPDGFTPSDFVTGSNTSKQDDPSRPALVVSSTSWTADEDFTPLIQALDDYQSTITSGTKLPKLLVVVTGKGALRAQFEDIVASREGTKWMDICVRCAFVSARDYPIILGSADLGLSFHSSSSSLDLPMKVVDMFGCGTPVLAKGYEAIGELVKDGVNGRIWNTPEDLGMHMKDLLTEFPHSKQLQKLHDHFKKDANDHSTPPKLRTILADSVDEQEWSSWDDNWDRVMHRGILHRKSMN